MTTTNGGPAEAAAQDAQPQLNVVAQYIKDLSFENPNAPRSLWPPASSRRSPSRSMSAPSRWRTPTSKSTLKLEGKAEADGKLMFGFELAFAGVFRIRNVPQESMNAVVLIECPRLLFPFAREIIANTVRNGGFPPLLLDPVDFVGLYRQRMAQRRSRQPAGAAELSRQASSGDTPATARPRPGSPRIRGAPRARPR